MDKNPAAHRGQRTLVEVKGTIEVFPRGDLWVIVDCHSKLTVSSAWGNRRSQRYGGKVKSTPARIERKWFFEVLYYSLSFVPPVHVRRIKLEFFFPQLSDDMLEVCTGLVISDIEINRKSVSCQSCHDGIKSRDAVFICFCLKSLL
jgi:hypothetical protein